MQSSGLFNNGGCVVWKSCCDGCVVHAHALDWPGSPVHMGTQVLWQCTSSKGFSESWELKVKLPGVVRDPTLP